MVSSASINCLIFSGLEPDYKSTNNSCLITSSIKLYSCQLIAQRINQNTLLFVKALTLRSVTIQKRKNLEAE